MKYLIQNKFGNKPIEIDNILIIESLNEIELVVGKVVAIFGELPHSLKVIEITNTSVLLESSILENNF